MNFQNKMILVLGAGISGRSVAAVLAEQGAQVIITDARELDEGAKDIQRLMVRGVKVICGPQDESLLASLDFIVVSPGISIDIPLLALARSRGITVISEIEVAYQLCQAPIIAITGTNGKTTTTTLIGEMLKASGKHTVIGGNIGWALSHEVQGANPEGMVVAEVSSFQLEGSLNFRPHIAVVLNLTPDHMDRHHTMVLYQAVKERIFANQTETDYLILNYDDPLVRTMASRATSSIVYFSLLTEMERGGFVRDGMMYMNWQGQQHELCAIKDMKLLGRHNIENALAACCAAFLAGVNAETMASVLKNFSAVEHRIELVTTVNGVAYYNDSKATNPESSVKALEAFDGHIILIAGGRDKNTDLTEFMTLVKNKVDHLILLGEAKERFQQVAREQGVGSIYLVSSMEDAIRQARELAHPPQVVLLSPACASYDMFNNYEERGRVFKQLVCS